MSKIIITGATSMLGTALMKAALKEGDEVFAIVRPDTNRMDRVVRSDQIHIVYGSLEDLNQIDNIPYGCDVFYHFAWSGTSKALRDDPIINEKNIQYSLEAVKLAEKTGCHRFVFAGSQAEYGRVDGIIDAKTRFSPSISYGIAKYAAGQLSRKLCDQKNIWHIWARIFSVYGPHDNAGTMLEYAVRCWNNGETAAFSSATQLWNYLYEDDAGEMLYRLGDDSVLPDTYFIASNESKPLKDYIRIMMAVYGDKAKAVFSDPGDVVPAGLNVDVSKTIEALNYIPKVSFEEGIKNTIEYLSNHMC